MKEIVMPPPPASGKKITLNLKQFVPPPAPKPKVAPPILSPQPIPSVTKQRVSKPQLQHQPKSVKKRVLNKKKRTYANNATKENNATKVHKKKHAKKKVRKKKDLVRKITKKKKQVKKQIVKKQRSKKRQKKKRSALANALWGAGTSIYPAKQKSRSRHSSVDRMIKQLYGKEFLSFSPAQKKFIRNNLGSIHRITQNTLTRNGYPDVAVRTGQQGVNIVTFYLHPNGDISGLRLKRRMGYTALDQNTLEVIRTAYMHYPRPKMKTKITFYVRYQL